MWLRSVISVLSSLFLLSACGAAPDNGADDEVARQIGSDLFLGGSNVRLREPARGDVVAAGRAVALLAPVAGDAVVAGGQLELKGPFQSDVYAAGGRVNLDGDVAGSLRAAGGSVRLGPEASLGGGASVAAGRVEILGSVQEYLQVAAGETHIEGRVLGDVHVTGNSLELGPATVIQGAVTFHGPEPASIAPGARVSGEVRHVAPDPAPRWLEPGLAIAWILGHVLVGAGALAIWPDFTRAVGHVAVHRTGRALLVGCGVLFGAPIAMLLMLLSIVGVPLALFTLYLYVLLIPLGYLLSSMAISDHLLDRLRPRAGQPLRYRVLALALVLLIASFLTTLPVAGGVLAFLLCAVGAGSLALRLWERSRSGRGRPSQAEPAPLGPRPAPQAG